MLFMLFGIQEIRRKISPNLMKRNMTHLAASVIAFPIRFRDILGKVLVLLLRIVMPNLSYTSVD